MEGWRDGGMEEGRHGMEVRVVWQTDVTRPELRIPISPSSSGYLHFS